MTKILTVVGARPQFVKAAVVSRALRQRAGIVEKLLHTGQHYDQNMSGVFFSELGLPPPDHNLGIGSGTHAVQTGHMLAAMEPVMAAERPDMVMVYGDTNSTLAGALCASKLRIPIVHVEAGLRSFNDNMPEEINRIVTDRISSLLFSPSPTATENLRNEGIPSERVIEVGDVMYDALLTYSEVAERKSRIRELLGLNSTDYILATIHRQENTDDPEVLTRIWDALTAVSERVKLVVPLHPRTRQKLNDLGRMGNHLPRMVVIPPASYFDMLALLKGARLVLTDSGGLQKEAYFSATPCVTLRKESEWTELIDCGWNVIAPPTSSGSLIHTIFSALDVEPPAHNPTIYGGGEASRRISESLERILAPISEVRMKKAG